MAHYFLLPKLLYLFLFAVFGSALPYLSIYYDQALHLSSHQIGIVLAIAPFIQSIACPLWTIVADRKPSWHGPLMAVLLAIGGTSVMMLMFLPEWLAQEDVNANTGDKGQDTSRAMLFVAIIELIFAFFGQPVSALVDSATLKILGEHKILYGNQRLWGSVSNGINILLVGVLISSINIQAAFYVFGVFSICFILLALFTRLGEEHTVTASEISTSHPYEDSPLLKDHRGSNYASHLHPTERHTTYSPAQQTSSPYGRSFFGTLINTITGRGKQEQHPSNAMYGVEASRYDSVASHANTVFLEDEDRHMDLMRITTSVAALDVQAEASDMLAHSEGMPSLGLVLSRIPTIDTSLAAFATIGQTNNSAIGKSTLKDPKVWTFLLMTLLLGIAYAMVAQFLFLYLRNDLNIDPLFIGWTGPIGGVTEVSTFYVSRQLLDYCSVTSLITFSHVVVILRNFVYISLIPNEWTSTVIALSMQLVSGVSYAMIWSTSVSEVDSFFPVDQRAMAQGILAALFSGLGYGLGSILGGVVYEQYGVNRLFEVSSGITVLSLLVFLSKR